MSAAAGRTGPFSNFDLDGIAVLGISTDLTPTAFAQAKTATLLSETGVLVAPDGRIDAWRCEGVAERDGRMVVWGRAFDGRPLAELAAGERPVALAALRAAAKAYLAVPEGERRALLPAACLIADDGAVLFLPERLALRSLDGAPPDFRTDADRRWRHPDLKGGDAVAFTLGALAYRAVVGEAPFPAAGEDAVAADIRDANFVPARLAAFGLVNAAGDFLDALLAKADIRRGPRGRAAAKNAGSRPDPRAVLAWLDGSPDGSAWFAADADREVWESERRRTLKLDDARLGVRRFGRKHAAALVAGAVIVAAAVFGVRGYVVDQAARPNTAGLSPAQLATVFYSCYNSLDHQTMSAYVIGKTAAADIGAVMNIFVISRVRESYEHKAITMSAADWLAAGRPATDRMVFGVTDFTLEAVETDESDGQVSYTARYLFWYPDAVESDAAGIASKDAATPGLPVVACERREDALTIERDAKGRWHISALVRRILPTDAPDLPVQAPVGGEGPAAGPTAP
jgi:hypothetical protein